MFDTVFANKEDEILCYCGNVDTYGLIVPDGGPAYVKIDYCPWCGEKFPPSKRNLLYDILVALGYDGFCDEPETRPAILNSDEWHKSLPNVDSMTPEEVIKALKLSPKESRPQAQKRQP
jgi:hypothetical protein